MLHGSVHSRYSQMYKCYDGCAQVDTSDVILFTVTRGHDVYNRYGQISECGYNYINLSL
jgi:hypothetical protein